VLLLLLIQHPLYCCWFLLGLLTVLDQRTQVLAEPNLVSASAVWQPQPQPQHLHQQLRTDYASHRWCCLEVLLL
jgi:hypothetical protein